MVPTRPGKRGATSPAAICAVKYSAAVLRERKLPSVHRGSQRYTLALKSQFSDIFGSLSIFFQRSRQLRHEVGHFIGELSQKSTFLQMLIWTLLRHTCRLPMTLSHTALSVGQISL